MKVSELISLLADMDPDADFVLLRDCPMSQENETEIIDLEIDQVVLAETWAGIQLL